MTEVWKQWEGQVLNGEFHLRQYLGGCEHSAVFLTEYGEGEPQKAAIILIPADPGNAELQLSRWRLAAKLSHPHLIRLFQMGRCQLGNTGLLYVVMEYAEEDLSQVLPDRPLTPAEAREMLEPALEALAYVHGKGFVHGHMKPANIMAVDDQVKVSSDRLCRIGESSGGLRKPGVYDPPEMAGGAILPAGDIWSLGMTLVEALTQRLPVWKGTEQGEPILPETVPAPFLDFARHCLRRDPQRRWTVADFAARLRETSPVFQEQATARPQELSRIRRFMAPAVVVGLAMAAILAGPRLLNRHPEARRDPHIARIQPEPEQRPVPPSRPEEEAKTPTGRLVRGRVVHQVLPDVPQKARDTIRGMVGVTVRVRVDRSGRVVEAELDSPGPSKYFANLALQAARLWKFTPSRIDGQKVSSEWILGFGFTKTGTKVLRVEGVR